MFTTGSAIVGLVVLAARLQADIASRNSCLIRSALEVDELPVLERLLMALAAEFDEKRLDSSTSTLTTSVARRAAELREQGLSCVACLAYSKASFRSCRRGSEGLLVLAGLLLLALLPVLLSCWASSTAASWYSRRAYSTCRGVKSKKELVRCTHTRTRTHANTRANTHAQHARQH